MIRRPPRSTPLSLHDALPILLTERRGRAISALKVGIGFRGQQFHPRSEEHTSELQSHLNLVCRLLLEKKNIGRGESLIIRSRVPVSVPKRAKATAACDTLTVQ